MLTESIIERGYYEWQKSCQEIGLDIKEDSPFEHTYAVAHTNGCIGYMPTKEAFQEGGYKTHSAYRLYGIYPMDQDVAEKMIGNPLKLIDKLR